MPFCHSRYSRDTHDVFDVLRAGLTKCTALHYFGVVCCIDGRPTVDEWYCKAEPSSVDSARWVHQAHTYRHSQPLYGDGRDP